ncbi:putative carboxypeptidase [Podospora australis]|uniref:Carboxypeptidase n=1 Tax=Podospora australis TaxID=1536484 RepID=A0AAN6WVU5_9PEZI|nr:putative carboxypeptidase [Podospora australis]
MKSLFALSSLLALTSALQSAPRPQVKAYDGFKVYRIAVKNQVAKVNDIIEKLGLETWKAPKAAGAMADVVVPPTKIADFNAAVAGLDVTTMHEDLAASIAEESTFGTYAVGSANATWFNSYHSYNDHLQFLRDLQATYPSRSAIVTSGNSLGGRAITGIHFWGSSGKGVKPAIIFHSTVHAREWITTMVNEYFAFNLLTKYDTDAEIKSFVDKYDFYIFPVVNPDGFVYTQTNERLWRKNRQTNSGSSCVGRDINRNWDFQWSVTGGASTNPCAEDYKGAKAADAPETAALASFIRSKKAAQGLKLFIDWHAYSQLFMTPYGYSCTARAAKHTELQSLAQGAAAAIKAVYGTSFKYGPICSTIYKATGSSVDWANDVGGSEYTFTAELRDTGANGFILPASQIVPSGVETWAGLRYLLLNMK